MSRLYLHCWSYIRHPGVCWRSMEDMFPTYASKSGKIADTDLIRQQAVEGRAPLSVMAKIFTGRACPKSPLQVVLYTTSTVQSIFWVLIAAFISSKLDLSCTAHIGWPWSLANMAAGLSQPVVSLDVHLKRQPREPYSSCRSSSQYLQANSGRLKATSQPGQRHLGRAGRLHSSTVASVGALRRTTCTLADSVGKVTATFVNLLGPHVPTLIMVYVEESRLGRTLRGVACGASATEVQLPEIMPGGVIDFYSLLGVSARLSGCAMRTYSCRHSACCSP